MFGTLHVKDSKYIVFAAAGALGGLAEIIWMYAYNLQHDSHLSDIGREIANTLRFSSNNPYLGLIIHLSLSLLIGIVFGKLIVEKFCKDNERLILLSSLLILSGIWFCSFKLILPLVNANMVSIVPAPISFISKMLFGVAMAQGLIAFNKTR